MRAEARSNSRQGAVLPIVTVVLIGLLSVVALAIDIGLVTIARSQAQAAADVGALAGARNLNGQVLNNKDAAIDFAKKAAAQNYILGQKITASSNITAVKCGMYRYTTDKISGVSRFQADFENTPLSSDNYGAIQVRIETSMTTFFGKLMGVNSMKASVVSTAAHRPRDLAIVLDFSGSMRDSSIAHYPVLFPTISGGLNADSRFPRFGPWSIYPEATPGNPNPMQRYEPYGVYPPNNYTVDTPHGPAMVNNFQVDPSNNSAKAFVFNNDLSAASFDIKNKPICTPTPASWSSQYSPNYVGDRWPLNFGVSSQNPTVDQYAKNVADMLFPTSISGTSRPIRSAVTSSTIDTDWELNGYDSPSLKFTNGAFKGYSMGPGYYGKTFYIWPPDPRFDETANPTNVSNSNIAQDSSGKWICDWRKRFFLVPSNEPAVQGLPIRSNLNLFSNDGRFLPQQIFNIDNIATLADPKPKTLPNYIPNYPAILQWIKRGPQTLPPSLRSGRILYYSEIPDTIPLDWRTGMILDSASLDQRFWKEYIDYVISSGNQWRESTLYGQNKDNKFGTSVFGAPTITVATPGPNGSSPYLNYLDVPVHPRAHLWFGPLTMICFIGAHQAATPENGNRGIAYNWNPGTCYEAHCWQLKAGINSALADIKLNHPNDLASMIFFSNYPTPMVPMGKDFAKMQNALFYPKSILDSLDNPSIEIRPYKTDPITSKNSSGLLLGDASAFVPNAGGVTNVSLGLMNAYNQFNFTGSYKGRRGAIKVVILETDGQANYANTAEFRSISGGGGAMEWTNFGNSLGGEQNSTDAAISLAWLIRQDSIGSNKWPNFPAYSALKGQAPLNPPQNYYSKNSPGFSTARSPALVHTIAFGQLFEKASDVSQRTRILEFLRNVQIAGGTSSENASQIEDSKVIVGTYNERIDKLRFAIRSIMQGGIQVSLIQ